ncbi:MAG: transglycosylase [gamma proteobacterium symbiont of Ctena orbiculata]|uniref:GlsB/YeaQ/YmgE family stress response membrane protein n=1 Tax=Candidatus Thiodiazotropha taylori TaxID=2792791 RepID=A0A944QVC3_9GAMM|nr:GlsB/YeaQ/YmgE family stress response membrane protein [Candidatus Thiodiazotropha taylori]PUB86885.1 MAG: GlsB/YeaQ/YmgE family stress response membrane protein [gamma proteobacterium symbiont of Ctena orbiculata]MBT2989854.1 GlsB/YeaQ/YmgE family stress response membrane protein [Candidatus Thiodiazotropha taylori]MBT2995432.1 GlsB/YeaQ/YmgE family stress response membrane protein [Candidatus Thiodiazotropha taylori]MBT3001564.1 GlsB/YeaQ/YmgE family stress response membrane protein [Candi
MNGLAFLLIGIAAGWFAGLIMKGRGYGLLGNLLLGVLGALIGGYLFNFIAIDTSGVIASLITATTGAILVLAIAGMLSKR